MTDFVPFGRLASFPMTETEVRYPAATRAAGPNLAFRPDIEGLRAVAVAAVVLFHAGVPGIGGGYIGVDVFFVISGFLITSLMRREVATTGGLSLLRFYGRRARRILPASSVVLVTVILAGYHWLGFLRGDEVAADGRWAALFASNFRFAAQGVDYLESQAAPSPLQHFWSLAVEEQFYFVWPALLVLLIWLGLRHFTPAVLAVAVAASLAWSVWQAGVTWSYFSPATRAWELGAGCLLALAAGRLSRIPAGVSSLMAGVGLAGIVVAALSFDDGTTFPGYAATLPVAATLLVLAGRGDALLGVAPLRWLGQISYSLYLWHWPVLIIATQAYGPLNGRTRTGLVLLSVVLAMATYALVENPIRRSARLRRSHLITAVLAVALILAPVAVSLLKSAASPGAGDEPQFQPRLGAPVAHVQP
jgi:peptidoglycan/LPS O-acetylase OafA/YrhL